MSHTEEAKSEKRGHGYRARGEGGQQRNSTEYSYSIPRLSGILTGRTKPAVWTGRCCFAGGDLKGRNRRVATFIADLDGLEGSTGEHW
jgi:hypothetical protein